MRALYLVRNGQARRAFELREVADPVVGEEDVLIDVEYSGVNFADVMARLGVYPDAPALPFVPGYEVVGRITALGAKVGSVRPELQVGTRVVALTRFGGYASRVVARALASHVIAEDVDGAETTVLATQGVTAWLAAEDLVQIHAGERVLIHAAAGGVGLLLVQLALRRGAEVIATVGSDDKVAFLKEEFGLSRVVNSRKQNFLEEMQTFYGDRTPVHVVFDSVGGKTFRQSKLLLAPGGRLVFFGVAEMAGHSALSKLKALWSALNFGVVAPLGLLDRSQSLLGLNVLRVADHQPERLSLAFKAIHELVAQGEIEARVGATFPIREVAQAHELLESRQSIGKIVLRW